MRELPITRQLRWARLRRWWSWRFGACRLARGVWRVERDGLTAFLAAWSHRVDVVAAILAGRAGSEARLATERQSTIAANGESRLCRLAGIALKLIQTGDDASTSLTIGQACHHLAEVVR